MEKRKKKTPALEKTPKNNRRSSVEISSPTVVLHEPCFPDIKEDGAGVVVSDQISHFQSSSYDPNDEETVQNALQYLTDNVLCCNLSSVFEAEEKKNIHSIHCRSI